MVIIPGSADLHFTDEDLADETLLELDALYAAEYEPATEADEPLLHSTMRLSPTVAKFVRSDADVNVIMGPRREGKSAGGIARLLRVAAEHPAAWPVRVAVVRDTWRNLERSLLPTLREGHGQGWWDVEIRESGTEAVLNGGQVHLFLFGMDNPKDASKFQSFECGIAWLEEPAPAADLSSGIPIDVFAMALTSLSQRDMPSSIQASMNPPDAGHWILELIEHLQELGHPEMRVEMFQIPPGENRHIKAGYREKMRIGLEQANRPDLIRRLVEGQIGVIIVGEPVTPEFSDLHIAKAPLQIRLAWPVIRGWDAWLSPACVWAQVLPSGHINVLGCVQGVNIGIEELIEEQVLPWERKFGLRLGAKAQPFGRGVRRGATFRDIGDPSMYARDQSSSERSARWSLEKILNTSLERAPTAWPARRDSIKAVLTRMFGGRPMLQLDPEECKLLIHALRGRWRYHKTPSGIVSAEPLKDDFSHATDALAYICAVLYPAHEMVRAAVRQAPERVARYQPPISWEGR